MDGNHFYEIFKPLLQRVYTARENFRADHYVSIPDIEEEIENYIVDASYSFAYLRAPKGSGKSTLLYNAKYIHDRTHPEKTNGMYIFDCRDNLTFDNPREKHQNESADSQEKLRRFLGYFIVQKLGREKFDEGRFFCSLEFAKFCQRTFLAHVDDGTRFVNIDKLKSNEKAAEEFLERFKREFLLHDDYIFSASISALIYSLTRSPESSITIIIDNTESIPFGDLCNLIEILHKCNGVFRTNGIYPTRFSILLSCRETTFEMLKVKGIENANGTQSTKQILHSAAAPLSEILRLRTKFNVDKFNYVTKNGTRINDIDARSAFNTFVDKMSESIIPNTIAKLTNHDLALSMELLEYVTKNPALGILEDLAWISVSDAKRLNLNEANVLACLLFGNGIQNEKTRYPVKSNKNIVYIPNLLNANHSLIADIFIKLRVYQAIKILSRSSPTPLINSAEVSEAIGSALGFKAADVFQVIRLMQKDGYLLSHEGTMQDFINDYDTVRVSPKLDEVVRLSSEYGMIIMAFLDELSENSEGVFYNDLPTNISIRSDYNLLHRELSTLWKIERTQLKRYINAQNSLLFHQLFGVKIWTSHFLNAAIIRLKRLIQNEKDSGGGCYKRERVYSRVLWQISILLVTRSRNLNPTTS